MNRYFTIIWAVLFMVLGLAFLVTAQLPDEDVLILHPSLFTKLSQPPVHFNHTEHLDDYGLECTECHHVYKGGRNVWSEDQPVRRCEECHTEPTTKNERRLPVAKQKLNLKLAFHNNCIGCHRKYNHENGAEIAPIRCQDCHKAEAP